MTACKLKIIACAAMLIDHIGAVYIYFGISRDTALYMRGVGRIAFFIFAYLIAIGCAHTGSIKKYLFRLSLFAIISEIPFNLFVNIIDNTPVSIYYPAYQNVLFTWAIAVFAIMIYTEIKKQDKIYKKTALWGAVIFLMIAAELIQSDYGLYGASLPFLLYVFNDKTEADTANIYQILTITIYALLLYYPSSNRLIYLSGAAVAVVCIYIYNGEQGKRAKWLFYVFYPLHIAVIAALCYII